MFGYFEPTHTVLAEHHHPRQAQPGTLHYEMRQRAGKVPYLAVFAKTPEGQMDGDTLLMYDDEAVARADWAQLIGPEIVHFKDLNYIERIEHHHIGYTKAGGVVMY